MSHDREILRRSCQVTRRELYEKRQAAHIAALVDAGEITLDGDGLPVLTDHGACIACGEPLAEPAGLYHKLCRGITTPRCLPDVDTPPESPTPHPAGRGMSGPRPADPRGVIDFRTDQGSRRSGPHEKSIAPARERENNDRQTPERSRAATSADAQKSGRGMDPTVESPGPSRTVTPAQARRILAAARRRAWAWWGAERRRSWWLPAGSWS